MNNPHEKFLKLRTFQRRLGILEEKLGKTLSEYRDLKWEMEDEYKKDKLKSKQDFQYWFINKVTLNNKRYCKEHKNLKKFNRLFKKFDRLIAEIKEIQKRIISFGDELNK